MIAGLAAFAWLASPAVFAGEARVGRPVMGTVLQLTVIVDGDSARAERVAEAALQEAERWDDTLTTWRAEGELARLDAAAGRGVQPVSPRLEQALRAMEELHRATGGMFDPAVGPLVRWWRDPTNRGMTPPSGPFRWSEAVSLGRGTAKLAPGAALDAGGIGKGIALDSLREMLVAEGVKAAFLDFGRSSLLAVGAPPDDPDGWLVEIAGLNAGTSHGLLRLRDAALSTSRSAEVWDETGSIIDPRSNQPIRTPRVATVMAPSATAAEAWTKALVILGRGGLEQLTSRGAAGMVEDAGGFAASAGFAARLQREEQRPPRRAPTAPQSWICCAR